MQTKVVPIQVNALIPLREAAVIATVGRVNKLPTFVDGVAKLKEDILSERLEDFPVEFKNLSMHLNGLLLYNESPMHYTKHALSQAIARIRPEGVVGMTGYMIACPPDLRSVNFNYWHQEGFAEANDTTKGNNILMRIRSDEFNNTILRAIVSQSYVPLDDLPILETLGSIVNTGSHLHCVRGDVKSRYSLIWPTEKTTVYPGEEVLVALRLVNSEAGASAVRLEPMVYLAQSSCYYIVSRYSKEIAIRHVGEAKKRIKHAYESVQSGIGPFIERLKESYNDFFESRFTSANQMFDCLGKALEISDAKIAAIKAKWQENGSITNRAGIGNAMIQVAQNLPMDAGEDLQRAASTLIQYGWSKLELFKTEA